MISEVVAPAIGEQAEAISELGAPSGEEEAVEAIVEAVESGAEEAEENPSSFLVETAAKARSTKPTNSPTNSG